MNNNTKKKNMIVSIIAVIILILFAMGITLNNAISYNDETILLRETINMAQGLEIYKDINVLTTPLFFYIGSAIMKILGANLFSFRIYGVLIMAFYVIALFVIMKKLKINNKLIYATIAVTLLFQQTVIKNGANYNFVAITLSLLSIALMIDKSEEKNKLYYITQGILTFLICMTKQNIGIYHFVAFAICEICLENYEAKKKAKNLVIYSLAMICLLGIYCLILALKGNLYYFIDYTILGMIDFKQNASIESATIVLALFNIVPILIGEYKNKIDKKQKTIFIFSCIMLLIAYPIVCSDHSKIALTYSIISLIYLIDGYTKNKYEAMKKAIATMLLVFVCGCGIYNLVQWQSDITSDEYQIHEDSPYYGAKYSENIDYIISAVTKYIEESDEKIIIISPKSSLFNLEMGVNNGILDLPLKGNVGENGKEKILNEIKNLGEDVKIILTTYQTYQEYEEVYEYVRENYQKVDNLIGMYDVYEIKK